MNVYLFVLFVVCLTNMVFVELTDDDENKSFIKFNSYEDACLLRLIKEIEHSQKEEKETLMQKYNVKNMSPNELIAHLKKFCGDIFYIEEVEKLIKMRKDSSFADNRDAFNLIKITGISDVLFRKTIRLSLLKNIPKLTVNEVYAMINNLYGLIDGNIRIAFAAMSCINDGEFKLEDLVEMDKRKNLSDGISHIFKTFLEDIENNFMYILRINGGDAVSLHSENAVFDARIPIMINRECANIYPFVKSLSMCYDFLANNSDIIKNIIKNGGHTKDFVLCVNVNAKKLYSHKTSTVIENINGLLCDNGQYKKVIMCMHGMKESIDFPKIRAQLLVLRLNDCSEGMLKNLSYNVEELSLKDMKLAGLVINENVRKLSLENVIVENSIQFSKNSKIEEITINEVKGHVCLNNVSSLSVIELFGSNENLRIEKLDDKSTIRSLKMSYNLSNKVSSLVKYEIFEKLEVLSIGHYKQHKRKKDTPRMNSTKLKMPYNNSFRYGWHSILERLPKPELLKELEVCCGDIRYGKCSILNKFMNLEIVRFHFMVISNELLESLPKSVVHLDVSFSVAKFEKKKPEIKFMLSSLTFYPPERANSACNAYDMLDLINLDNLTYLDIGNVDFECHRRHSNTRYQAVRTLLLRDSTLTVGFFNRCFPNITFLYLDECVALTEKMYDHLRIRSKLTVLNAHFSAESFPVFFNLLKNDMGFFSLQRIGDNAEIMSMFMHPVLPSTPRRPELPSTPQHPEPEGFAGMLHRWFGYFNTG